MCCMIFLSPFIDIEMVYISRISFLESMSLRLLANRMFSFDLCLDLKLLDIFGLFLPAFPDFLFFFLTLCIVVAVQACMECIESQFEKKRLPKEHSFRFLLLELKNSFSKKKILKWQIPVNGRQLEL